MLDVTAEVPVAAYPPGQGPDPGRAAGVDLGIIHPYAAAGPGGAGAAGVRAGDPGRMPAAPARPQGPHPRRRRPGAQARAARVAAVAQAPAQRAESRGPARPPGPPGPARGRQAGHHLGRGRTGSAPSAVGDPRGVLNLKAGRRHNQRTRDWRVGHLIRALSDKAEAAGITVHLVDERGTSSTCPTLRPAGTQARRAELHLPALRAARAPRPGRGRQHRRPRTWRRHHPRRPARAGDHAPSRREPTCPVCTPRGVTRGAGPHHGPHPAGTWPAPARPAPRPTTAATRGVARTNARSPQARRDNPDEPTDRCT